MKNTINLTQIIITNIDSLLKEKNIKVGSFEKKIGITSGYISRIRNGKYNFTLDLLCKISNALNVSIDYLSTDFNEKSSDEKELIKFFESIYQDTFSNNLIWSGRNIEQIMNPDPDDDRTFFELLEGPIWSNYSNPLESNGYPLSGYLGSGKMIDNVLYTRTEINDGFYHTTIIKDEHPTELYLYSLEYSDESKMCKLSDVIEAYITIDKHKQNPKSHFVCSSVEWSGNISCKMKQLYKLAKTETSTNQLDTTVKSIIHSYNKQTK